MKDYIYTANIHITVPAENAEQAWARIDDFFQQAKFPIEIDWMEIEDSYDIES